jgi:histone H3/H4
MNEPNISVTAMHRICLKSGAKRVSDAASKELAETLEKIGLKIAKDALDYAVHSGRRTIKAEDIELAAKKIIHNGLTL